MTDTHAYEVEQIAGQPMATPVEELPIFPVVGLVGAAGSRQALETFFRHVPSDSGMAFVVVTRLAAKQHSQLAVAIEARTDMPVLGAADGVVIQLDHIYIAPLGTRLTIVDGILRFHNQSREAEQGLLDTFLFSLAVDQHENAVAILLSGTGEDGIAGIEAVKTQGGAVLVQEPDNAAHPALPRRGVATGIADHVNAVAAIAQYLTQIRGDLANVPLPTQQAIDESFTQLFTSILAQIITKTGHDLSHYKASTLQRRIARCMQMAGIQNLANEELQSINEELKSTTEELETSKEELQSMNEELITVNHELKFKLDELSRLNSDLLNLIASTDVGVIFLDQRLFVKRFTPRATELFHLIETDLGHPFAHIAHRIRLNTLATRPLEYAARVLETLEQVEVIIQSEDERWSMLRFFPYRTIDQVVDGVVITFIDISDLKRAESEVQQRIQQQAVAELGRQALRSDDLPDLLTSATACVAQTLEIELCSIFALETENGEERLRLQTGVGWPTELMGQVVIEKNSDYPSWAALAQDEPIWVEDVHQQERLRFSPIFSQQGVVSGVSVAIGGSAQPYGVLSAYSKRPSAFTVYEISFVQSIANLLGEALARQQAEAQVRASEERLRLGVSVVGLALAEVDYTTDTIQLTAEAAALFGLPSTPAVVARQTVHALFHPDDRDELLRHIAQALDPVNGGELTVEHRLVRPDGAVRWLNVRKQIFFAPNANGVKVPVRSLLAALDITERKQAEQQVAFHASLLNYAYDAVIATDAELKLTAWNRGAESMYGWPAAEALGQIAGEIVRSTITPEARAAAMRQMIESGHSHVEITTYHRDGTPIVVEAYNVPMRDALGQVTGFMSISRDIGERKAAEEALRQSEERYRTLANAMPQLVWTANAQGDVDYYNVRIDDYDPAVRLAHGGFDWQRFVHPDDLGPTFAAWQVAAERNEPYTCEHRLRMADHSWRWHLSLAMPVPLDGNQLKWYGTATDIHEHKEIEEALRTNEERLNAILYNIPASVYLLTTDHRYLLINHIYEQENNISNAEIHGQSVYDRWPPEIAEALAANERYILMTKAPLSIEETVLRDGEAFYYATVKAPLLDAAGEPYAIIGISTNITDRKRAEEALRQSEERYRTLFETMDEGFSVIEMIFDTENQPLDYRFLEVNPAFARFTGLENAQGKTARQLVPNLEQHWFEIYGHVALTGEPRRFTEGSPAMGRWFEVYAFRFGGPESRRVALLFTDITERKRVEDEVQRSRNLLQRMAEATPDDISIYDRRQQQIIYSNRRSGMSDFSGQTTWSTTPAEIDSHIHPDDVAQVQAEFQRIHTAADGEVVETVFRQRQPDGDYCWHQARTVVFARDKEGQVIQYLSISTDIDDRKHAERNQQFLSELSVALSLISDPTQIQQTVVQRLGEYLGASRCRFSAIDLAADKTALLASWRQTGEPPPLTVIPLSSVVSPTYLADAQAGRTLVVHDVSTDGRSMTPQQLLLDRGLAAQISVPCLRNGQWVASLHVLQSTPRQWRAEEVQLVESVVRQLWPLVERARAEEALRVSELRFRSTFENAAVGIAEIGLDGRWLRVNERLTEIVGYSAAELQATTFQAITHPDDLAADLVNMQRVLAGEAERHHLEKRYFHKEGHLIWIYLSVALLRDQAGVPQYFIAVIEDINERKQQEQALLELNATLDQRVRDRTAELERSNRELDRFAYVASHDLKSPLRGIDTLATWISEDADAVLPDASKGHLSKLRGRIKRLETLLDDLLAYSRAGRYQYSPESVATGPLVEGMLDLLDVPATFNVTVADPMPKLLATRTPLETVLRNLINNAIKHHNRSDGHIRIAATDYADYVEFTVSDDGPGIDPQYHERIFELFQTLKPRDQVEGSGMGLAIVQKTIENYGGSIKVESTQGEGATFRFTWPKWKEEGE